MKCRGVPLLRPVEKRLRMRLPSALDEIANTMIERKDPTVNDFMPLVRIMNSQKKHSIDMVFNDIIIYLEAATLPYKTGILLTNDNEFF